MASPVTSNMGVPSFTVLVGGTDIGTTYAVKSILITKELNKISKAKIIIFDGNPGKQTFDASTTKKFDPNVTVSIKLGYAQTEVQVFSGIVVSQSLKVRSGASELAINCMDKAFQLSTVRKTKNFAKKKDSDVISEIIGAYGVTKTVTATTFKHPNLVQYNCSDWDFILARADANAMVVINEDAKLTIAAPVVSGTAVLDLTYGLDVLDFFADMDAMHQLASVEFKAWDSEKLALVTSAGTEPSVNSHGDLTGKTLSTTAKSPKLTANTSVPEETSLLKSWAKSHLQHARLSKIRGFVSFIGSSKPKVGSLIKLAGFSAHFNGSAYLTKVTHTFENGFWKTETGFGLQPKTVTDIGDIEGPGALGLLPSISGLHLGKVKKMHTDPAGEFRVQVDVPFIESTGEGLWARMSHPYASADVGYYFYPEVGDEVVLSFLNGDPRFAIIIGSLYGKKNKPPFTPEAKNKDKGIITKSKIKITFDDKDKIMILETPGGQKITFDDKAKLLKMEDQNKNSILFDDKGIHIKSSKDLDLTAGGDINVKASSGAVVVKSKSVKIEGSTTVGVKGASKLTLEGPSVEVKGSGTVAIKGGAVNIN
ncbi:MAG: type VI secretion system tip protein VgrG [Flammeovirgaceae bacterium]|nr:type VI secretion system tip protein VgrG [Flammeovirgaceae bacterium]